MYSHPESKSLCNYGVLCIAKYKKTVKKKGYTEATIKNF